MRGARRFAIALWATGLLLGPIAVSAQETTPPTTNAPATDAVGPPQLQNFSLQGTVTRAADQPQSRTSAPPPAEPTAGSQSSSRTATKVLARRSEPLKQPRAAPSATAQPTEPAPRQVQQLSVEPPASALPTPPQTAPEPRQATTFPPAPDNATPAHGFALLPWLLAAFALGAGGAFLLLRNRNRTATAGGPELDLFAAPEPVAELPPAPAPPRSPEPAPPPPPKPIPPTAPTGIVSTALRPWIEIAIQPQRCVVTERDVTIEFDLELFNSGGNPARDISIEGVIINAGASQDAELGSFFANPPVPGNRIDVIRPIHRVNIPTQLVIPRAFVVPVQMGDRQMFVPVLAFNAIYPVGSSEGRTSVSFLVGRDGNGDKLAPFRLDLGPRVFRQLGARQLPTGIRR